MPKVTYWTGGAKERWFVVERTESPWVGEKPTDRILQTFPSEDYPNGELGACRAAEAAAELLNLGGAGKVRVCAALISEKARFHAERAEPGSNAAEGMTEIADLAARILQELAQ